MAEKKSILTLNLGSQRIAMARFGLGAKGTLLLREYGFEELPGDLASDSARKSLVTAAVKSLTGQLRAKELPTNYALAAQTTITRFVKLPSLGEDQVDKIVGFEAQQAVPFPLTETVWDYQVMGKAGGEVEVAIVAVRADQLEEINQSISGASLNTKLVDAAPLALYNAFRYNYGEPAEPTLLLDLGAKTTNLIFIEGGKVFISSFQNAGSQITQAISKEMEWDFASAEERKKVDGFVHLGGNYADHEDPEVDSMSKIIRNQLTRLHGDVNRRTQQYRQQGGSAPGVVYLAGAGANLPYIKEFLEEKLRVPVQWFNALQNVGVGPKVNVEQVSRDAHCLGELVGLALREMSCPMEIDLSPRTVETARSVAAKKPVLITAAACLAAGLGALWMHFNTQTSSSNSHLVKVEEDIGKLEGFANQIKAQDKRQKEEESRATYLRDAVSGRSHWLSILNAINSQFTTNSMWLTQLQPVDADGNEILKSATGGGVPVPDSFRSPSASSGSRPGTSAPAPGEIKMVTVDALHLAGLFQKNEVRDRFLQFKDLKDLFDVPDNWEEEADKWYKADTGRETVEWASKFEMRLPLRQKFKVPVPLDTK